MPPRPPTPAPARVPRSTSKPKPAQARRRSEAVLVGAPLQRVWHIHARLSRGERVTIETLATELEVTTRTIKRDLDFMRDRLGLPIEWDASSVGGLLVPSPITLRGREGTAPAERRVHRIALHRIRLSSIRRAPQVAS